MIPIYKPYLPEDLKELDTILHSGKLSYGVWGRQFEASLTEFLGVKNVLTTNSYNSAALVALSTIDLEAGDVILASPMSCLASNQPIASKNLKIRWVDIDPETGTMDPASLIKKIDSSCKAIIHNHFCGTPGYIDEILSIGRKHGLIVIDDCIEAFWAEYKGNKLGHTGADISLFSFQTVRLPNTIEGGAVVFRNIDLYNKASRVRDYGIQRNTFRNEDGEINNKSNIEIVGYGALMPEINSYIGVQQMPQISKLIAKQHRNAEIWDKFLLDNIPSVSPIKKFDFSSPNYWVYGVLAPNNKRFIRYFRSKGFYATSVHISNTHYSVFGSQDDLLGVKTFEERFLALPSGWWVDLDLKNIKYDGE